MYSLQCFQCLVVFKNNIQNWKVKVNSQSHRVSVRLCQYVSHLCGIISYFDRVPLAGITRQNCSNTTPRKVGTCLI